MASIVGRDMNNLLPNLKFARRMFAVFLLVVGCAAAESLCSSQTTLAGLEALGSCLVGNISYSGFSFSSSGSLNAANIKVSAHSGLTEGLSFGFALPPHNALGAAQNQTQTVDIGYTVQAVGFYAIDAAGSQLNGRVKNSTDLQTENYCLNSSYPCSPGNALVTQITPSTVKKVSTTTFSPAKSVAVYAVLTAQGGAAPGDFALIRSFSEVFKTELTSTPEPAGMGLIGAGLLLAGLLRRKRSSVAAAS